VLFDNISEERRDLVQFDLKRHVWYLCTDACCKTWLRRDSTLVLSRLNNLQAQRLLRFLYEGPSQLGVNLLLRDLWAAFEGSLQWLQLSLQQPAKVVIVGVMVGAILIKLMLFLYNLAGSCYPGWDGLV
jgi:hypothetical protein